MGHRPDRSVMINKVAAVIALITLGVLSSCVPPRDVQGAIDQDIAAGRDVGPTSGAIEPPPASNVVNVPFEIAAPNVPAPPSPAATPGDPRSGRSFALENCTQCHVVTPDRASPLRSSAAPDFSVIANDKGVSPVRLNIWLHNPHPTMPTLVLSRQQAADVVAYILSLRESH